MPKNISFRYSAAQIRDRTKTVTRRLGWTSLKPDDVLNACVKLQGLMKGDKIEKICQIRIISARRERLDDIYYTITYGPKEMIREGFPEMTAREFVKRFCKINLCQSYVLVTRILFEYIES